MNSSIIPKGFGEHIKINIGASALSFATQDRKNEKDRIKWGNDISKFSFLGQSNVCHIKYIKKRCKIRYTNLSEAMLY